MRYLRRLADKDIALDRAMIPFAPDEQTVGYRKMIDQLEAMLCACTGYDALSLQPNAGSQGEYAGLLAIRRYHDSRDEHQRDVCLIPSSAHGTNPASAQMAGMRVVVTKCDDRGNVDLDDLDAKIAKHEGRIAAIMITYPSTHGVFESAVRDICQRVHDAGGQVGYGTARPVWRRRLASEFAQDLLHSSWRRWTRSRSDWCGCTSGAVSAWASGLV